jgi:hypothetical protein
MKQTKILAMLFIAILTMGSCAKEDNATTAFRLKQRLVGEWIMELPVSGIEADPVSDIVIPDDADMLTLIFHFDADGYGWKELNVMREGEMIYSAMNRYETEFKYTIDEEGKIRVDYDEKGGNDELLFSDYTLTYYQDGIEFYLERATDEQIQSYKKASDEWHGGSDEGGTIDTGIDNGDAGEPSRSKQTRL